MQMSGNNSVNSERETAAVTNGLRSLLQILESTLSIASNGLSSRTEENHNSNTAQIGK